MASILSIDEAIRRAGAKSQPVKSPSVHPATPTQKPAGTDATAQSNPRVSMGVAASQGLRDHMEDAYQMIKDFKIGGNEDASAVYLALFDGHSSHRGSSHAAARLHEILAAQPSLQTAAADPDRAALKAALVSAFEEADEEIIATAEKSRRRYGTTAVCALFLGGHLYVAHVGDSRAVLCRGPTAVGLTRDHKPASDPSERARIEAAGGQISLAADRVLSNPEAGGPQSRLNMSRALGDAQHKWPRRLVESAPAVKHVTLTPYEDSFVILGTDGLWDVMSGERACGIANGVLERQGGGAGDQAAAAAAQALVEEALRLGTSDNVTAAVALLRWG